MPGNAWATGKTLVCTIAGMFVLLNLVGCSKLETRIWRYRPSAEAEWISWFSVMVHQTTQLVSTTASSVETKHVPKKLRTSPAYSTV